MRQQDEKYIAIGAVVFFLIVIPSIVGIYLLIKHRNKNNKKNKKNKKNIGGAFSFSCSPGIGCHKVNLPPGDGRSSNAKACDDTCPTKLDLVIKMLWNVAAFNPKSTATASQLLCVAKQLISHNSVDEFSQYTPEMQLKVINKIIEDPNLCGHSDVIFQFLLKLNNEQKLNISMSKLQCYAQYLSTQGDDILNTFFKSSVSDQVMFVKNAATNAICGKA